MSDKKSVNGNLFEYTEKIAALFPEKLRQAIDDQLVLTIGADSPIIWAMDGKIYLNKVYSADGEEIGMQLAYTAVMPGYNAERHLYSLDSKIYVEDDYVWLPAPKLVPDEADALINAGYADDMESRSDSDEEDDEIEEDLNAIANDLGIDPTDMGEGDGNGKYFQANVFKEDFSKSALVNYEPLTVNSFNLDCPILGVEKAYRNAMCEIESFDTPGYIVLMHNGHFYIPVETFEDPVNHDIYHVVKIFNSFPCSAESARLYNIAAIELFGQNFGVGFCFRPGFSINWHDFIFGYLLPPNYQDSIANLYQYADKPYGAIGNHLKRSDYDGFIMLPGDDDCDEEDGSEDDEEDGDGENESPSNKTEG
ncbi:hypothetical protein IJH10_02635 [Candidatus Saccharibacteria bacterium]|nr:hypothetical protein [Candidatus Saccharibacteria bacterium]